MVQGVRPAADAAQLFFCRQALRLTPGSNRFVNFARIEGFDIQESILHIRSATREDAPLLANLVARANRDVARRFGLDASNCPKHPSFCTAEWILADFDRAAVYFIAEDDGAAVGCVAFEDAGGGVAYLSRLAVLSGYRRKGTGGRLVRHVFDHAVRLRVSSISIGIIAAHTELREWYIRLGFIQGEIKSFPHLPFQVAYLTRAIDAERDRVLI